MVLILAEGLPRRQRFFINYNALAPAEAWSNTRLAPGWGMGHFERVLGESLSGFVATRPAFEGPIPILSSRQDTQGPATLWWQRLYDLNPPK